MEEVKILSETVIKIEVKDEPVDSEENSFCGEDGSIPEQYSVETGIEAEEEELEPPVAVFFEPVKKEKAVEEEKDLLAPCSESTSVVSITQEDGLCPQDGELNPFECTTCRKVFPHNAQLKAHIRILTNDKSFGCSICQKNITQKGHLSSHMCIHSGEKPFDCLMCEKRFTEKGPVYKHMRIHTGEKPFVCSSTRRISLRRGSCVNTCVSTVVKNHLLVPFARRDLHKREACITISDFTLMRNVLSVVSVKEDLAQRDP